jgi:hypothetical protein
VIVDSVKDKVTRHKKRAFNGRIAKQFIAYELEKMVNSNYPNSKYEPGFAQAAAQSRTNSYLRILERSLEEYKQRQSTDLLY